ncbi:hypothetical protein [Luedemannella helvata]|uniref:Uncharacterized protein n=1 Tax=Luedemannella helvata TaxID=349315 RepID=A0ABP4VY45_9ACTN
MATAHHRATTPSYAFPDVPEASEKLVLDLPRRPPADPYAVYDRPLHDDLLVVYGAHHEETREVADVLVRLRLTANE